MLSDPNDIATGPDGNLWFTNGGSAIVGVLADGELTGFPTTLLGTTGMTAGPGDGNMWFTGTRDNSIGVMNLSGVSAEFTGPAIAHRLRSFPASLAISSSSTPETTRSAVVEAFGIPPSALDLGVTSGKALVGGELVTPGVRWRLTHHLRSEEWSRRREARPVDGRPDRCSSGLMNGTTYTFTVQATNGHGAGATAISAPVVPAGTPSAPMTWSLSPETGRPASRGVAPTRDGGAPITGFVVTPYNGDRTQPSVTVGPDVTSIIVGHLTNGRAYRFQVVATNVAWLAGAVE